MSAPAKTNMKYRFLGNTGLLVSTFSFGSWVSFDNQLDFEKCFQILEHAYKQGINFFDNAENYADGMSERLMGKAVQAGIERGVWEREDLVLSTKMFFGGDGKKGVNDRGLSRKHIIEGTRASLKRMQVDYVDLIYCHRPDPRTPLEETVRAMNYVIDQGWAFYWGTSEWSALDIHEACRIADRLGMIGPAFEQPQYNLLERSRVDHDFVTLYPKYGYGLTTFSPLASGILTGKYSKGIPEGSRLSLKDFQFLTKGMEDKVVKADKLKVIADELGCSLAQLSLAWCASNPNVSSVILGASKIEQLDENLKALEIIDKLTPEIKQRMDDIVDFRPELIPRAPQRVYDIRDNFVP